MRAKKLEWMVIKLSILIACLVIGAGLGARLLADRRPALQTATKTATASQPASSHRAETVTPAGQAVSEDPQPQAGNQQKPKGKIVAIGDSYTYGYPYGTEYSWVKAAGEKLGREIINKGKPTQTSLDLLGRFKTDVLDSAPESVIILAGTGDALRGVSLDTYQKNVQEMVRLAKDANITPVLGMPVSYPDPNARKLIKAYRNWLVSFAQQGSINTIDFDPVLFDNLNYKQGLSEDGKYPSKQGYAIMADQVAKNGLE